MSAPGPDILMYRSPASSASAANAEERYRERAAQGGDDNFEDVFYKNRELMAKIRVEFAHILALREAIEAAVQNDGAYVDGIGLASSYEGPDEEDDDVLPQAPPLVRMRGISTAASAEAVREFETMGNDEEDGAADVNTYQNESGDDSFYSNGDDVGDMMTSENGGSAQDDGRSTLASGTHATDTFANVLAAAYDGMRVAGDADEMRSVFVRKSLLMNKTIPQDTSRKGSLLRTNVRTETSPRTPDSPELRADSPGPSATLITPAVQKRAFRGSVWQRREFAGYLYKKPRTTSMRNILNLRWQQRWFEISTHYLRYHRSHSDKQVLGAIDLNQIRGCEHVRSTPGVSATFCLHFKGTRKMYLKVRATESFPNPLHVARTWMAVIEERLAEIRAASKDASAYSSTKSQRQLAEGYSEKALPTLEELLSPHMSAKGGGLGLDTEMPEEEAASSPFDAGTPSMPPPPPPEN